MNQQEARAEIDRALDTLAAQLDAGRSDAMTRYLAGMTRFHTYSWGNQLLIQVQDPEATRVAGYQTWKSMGRQVERGAKGLMILAPIRSRLARADDTEEGGEPRVVAARHFRVAHVFDIRFTEGKDLPSPPQVQGDPGLCYKRLEEFVMYELGVQVDFVASLGGAQGRSMNGRIEILRDLPPAQKFATLCHEAGHEILHWSVPEDVRKDKTLVETQAEAVAFIVCQAISLDCGAASADYISLYRGNKETLRMSLAAIHKAATPLLRAVLTPPEEVRPEQPGPAQAGKSTRGVRTGSPLTLCRDLPNATPALGSFVQVQDLPTQAHFITDEKEVRDLNIEYARKIGAYDSFFVLTDEAKVLAVWGLRGLIPWLDRETVLLYDSRRP